MLLVATTAGCGRKGPPLPPLLHVPAAPEDFTAERRGDEVKLQFVAPAANSDGTRPANIDRVEVYGFTGPFTVNDDVLLKFGSKVATVTVRAPKDPAVTTEPDEPPEEPELREEGIDQGAVAQLVETLTAEAAVPAKLPKDAIRREPKTDDVDIPVPLLGPPSEVPWRIFVAVGVNTKGRKGPPSKRITVPLVAPPSAPTDPAISYDEHTITLTWKPSPSWAPVQQAAESGLLPATYFGLELPKLEYQVYDVSSVAAGEESNAASHAVLGGETRLTPNPVAATAYADTRMDWGRMRCYGVRAFETVAGQTLESDMSRPVCVTLQDTFPPATPKNLQHIASEGVISLIWEPNNEPDLAGYLVLRGRPPGDRLEPLTPMPISATVFEDKVASGARYVYAVIAIDRAGNQSPRSVLVEDAAR